MIRLCFALDHGRPCNRRVMKPFGFCDQHREQPARKTETEEQRLKRQQCTRDWKRRKAASGVLGGWEAA